MRLLFIMVSWLLGIVAFILAATTGAFVAPGLMVIVGSIIRPIWIRGFSIFPIGLFLPLCGMWWSIQKQFTSQPGILAARVGCFAIFAFLVIYGIISDVRKFKTDSERGHVA